ncbi:MAG: hypothetical protein JRI89_17015, partial [Deltaproteobacteria bacterium]|nr:hypothetical protein [Deltaproteobacteria bacterium]
MTNYKKYSDMAAAFLVTVLVATLLFPTSIFAEQNADYDAFPPYVSKSITPNVLVILDNSNSMDEDVVGNAVGSAAANSRSEIARQAILSLIQANADRMRIGLMSYQQTNVQRYELHNSFYYCAYDPTTYDPNGTFAPKDDTVNTMRYPNPSDAGHYIYYDQALPMYSSGSLNNAFCYSSDFTEDGNSGNDHYRCYTAKTGISDPPLGLTAGVIESPPYNYTNHWFNTTFIPTDEDIAAGFTEFGKQLSWVHTGPTWFANSSPGKGYLHVPVTDSTSAHLVSLQQKLDTCNFSTNSADHPNNDLDTPIRNAGLTPIAGTLESARLYFEGNLPTNQGGPQPSPIQYWCQKNFVVLVTDGLPSVDKNGATGDADSLLPEVVNEVQQLRTTTVAGFANPFDIQTFVLGFAIPPGLGSKLDDIAVAGGTDVNGHAYLASDAAELSQTLNSIFLEIFKRVSSGTAASVISNARAGEGAVYQSIFYPSFNDSNCSNPDSYEISWVGQVHALLVDAYGNMREDTNNNRTLDLQADKIIIFHNNYAYKFPDNNGNGRLEPGEGFTDTNNNGKLDFDVDTILGSVEQAPLTEVDYLWCSNNWLNEIPDANIPTQRTYATPSQNRYIFTFLDTDGDMVAKFDGSEQVAFSEANAALISPYLHLFDPFAYNATTPPPGIDPADFSTFLTAQSVREINYIRGQDQADSSVGASSVIPAMRSRQVDYDCDGTVETWRLGDAVHSTPTLVGRPGENYDLLFRDQTYKAFYAKYRHRRNVVYAGANDGMLHAFNAGFFDPATKKFWKGYDKNDTDGDGNPFTDTGGFELGTELWAYVPFNLLPHLYWLTKPDYSHVYYVDLKPKVFDARIYDPTLSSSDTHPYGWATLLVGGMRLGGGMIRTDRDHDGSYDAANDIIMKSAYFILDITDPEQPPKLLAEITFDELGYTTSYPAVITLDPKNATTANKWYLALGSGPIGAVGPDSNALDTVSSSQHGKLYLVDLKELARADSNRAIKVIDQGGQETTTPQPFAILDEDSYVSDLVSVDLDLDYKIDVLYFGTVAGSTGDWEGKLRRVVINSDLDATHWIGDSTLIDVEQPISTAPTVARDREGHTWVFFGTGRFMNRDDVTDTSQQTYYGVKEPWTDFDSDNVVDVGESLTWGSVDTSDLANVSNAEVFVGGDVVTNLPLADFDGNSDGAVTFNEVKDAVEDAYGWKMNFSTSKERNLGQAALLGDILTFTSYIPDDDICQYEGTSKLYTLYYLTGTAYTRSIIGVNTGNTDTNGNPEVGNPEVLKSIDMGKGLTITPNIHSGREKGSKAFVQISTGAIAVIQQANPGATKSGKVSWQEE